jgi:hypothetical protein
MNIITRIWEGKKETATHPYYCGQTLIETGRLAGTWSTVTTDQKTGELARFELVHWLENQCQTQPQNN